MAYLAQSELEKQRLLEQQQGQAPTLAAPSGVINGIQADNGTQAAKGPSKSGSYTNLQSYLSVNKDQAGQLGQRIATNITTQANDAKAQLSSADEQFKNQVNQGSINNINTAKSDADNIVKDAVTKNTVGNDQLGRFKELRDASYKGPTSLLDNNELYQSTANKVNKANESSRLSATDDGRYTLLSQMFGRPNYSTGEKRLDNLLVSASDEGKAALKDASNSTLGLEDNFKALQDNAQTFANQRKQQTDEIRNYAKGLVDTEEQAFKDSITKRLNETNANNSALVNRLKQDVTDSELDAETLEKLGLSEGTNLYNVNLGDFLTSTGTNATKEQVATRDEFARYNALAQLAGVDPTFLNNQFIDQSGTYSPYNFDSSRLINEIAASKAGYESQISNLNSQIQNANNRIYELTHGGLYGDPDFMGPDGKAEYYSLLDGIKNAQDQINSLQSTTGARAITRKQ